VRRALLLLATLFLVGCGESTYTTTGGTTMSTEQALNDFGSAGSYQQAIDPMTYLNRLFLDPFDPTVRLYIPKYAYFQGLAYSKGKLEVVGQVRALGGGVAQGDIGMRDGGMVTTNPDYLLGRFTPARTRYKILEWKETR